MSDIVINGVTYRKQYRKCGNPNCRCAEDWSKAHGPYWYADGTKYIGKELPEWILNHLALLQTEKDHLQELCTKISERAEHHRVEMRRAEDEQRAISALLMGTYVDQRILERLGLEKFSVNGHKK
jgi:hypothetical protein